MTGHAHRERDPQWITRALREFLAVPLVVVGIFAVAAALSIVLDQSHASWLSGPRHTLSHVVGPTAAASALSAIATGLVTVTSITFSVLLLAVQQTAANLSPVVFGQFVRRRSNQVYLGFFVGLGIYSYVVLAAVQKDTPPTLGAAVAVVLTIAALLILLTLVYSTLNQMRPVHVISAIHTRALNARVQELELLQLTRETRELAGPAEAVAVSAQTGYVTSVRLPALGALLHSSPGAEVELLVTIGQHVAAGERLAVVRGVGSGAEQLATALRDEVVPLGRQREPDIDASVSVDQLANIAWTCGSTAKQSPEVAAEALDALRDLLGRWSVHVRRASGAQGLPVVYRDNDRERVVDAMLAMVAVAHESQQQQTAARALSALTQALPGLREQERTRIAEGLREAAPLIAQGAWMPKLRTAAADCADALSQVRCPEAAEALRAAFAQEHHARHQMT